MTAHRPRYWFLTLAHASLPSQMTTEVALHWARDIEEAAQWAQLSTGTLTLATIEVVLLSRPRAAQILRRWFSPAYIARLRKHPDTTARWSFTVTQTRCNGA